MIRFINESKSTEELDLAIKSYTAKGGQLASKFPYKAQYQTLLIKSIKRNTPVIAYRGYGLTEKQWETKFENGYTEIGNINIEPSLVSFSLDKNRRGSYSVGQQSVFLKIKLKNYLSLIDKSIYPEEQELLAYNLKWKVTKEWEYKHGIAYLEGEEI